MNLRKTFLAVSLAVTLPVAFADNFVGGEMGYETHPLNSTLTREQVRREYEAFRAHPVYADGTVMLQGEAGYVSAIQGVFADRMPNNPHTHVLGNAATGSTKAAATLTPAEERDLRMQYIN
jgi:hypothetical protein